MTAIVKSYIFLSLTSQIINSAAITALSASWAIYPKLS